MQMKRTAAISSYHKSLAIMENVGDNQNTRTILVQSNLGVTYSEIGKHYSALFQYEKAYGLALQILGPNHFYISEIQKNIAISAAELGDFGLAEKNAEDALTYLNWRAKYLPNCS